MEKRYLKMHDIETRSDDDGSLYIEGYFAVYGDIYEVWSGATESIAEGAFDESIHGDVRSLYNHNMDIVLGRTSAGTLELKTDSHGLWGKVKLNRNDSDAMNAYERIKRGDVTGCSIGFDIAEEETEYRDDGTIHWTLKKIDPLYEVSPCVFPAYEATSIAARGKEVNQIKKRRKKAWETEMLKKLKGE